MRHIFTAMLLAGLSVFTASNARAEIGGVFNMGVTFGGDTIATAYFSDGSKENLTAGGVVFFAGGVTTPLAGREDVHLQATLGYHVDNVVAKNGSMDFVRYPIDMLVFKDVSDRVQIGGGIAYHLSPTAHCSLCSPKSLQFDDALGVVVELDWIFGGSDTGAHIRARRTWFGVRYVNIEYTESIYGGTADGSHVGLTLGASF